MGVRHCSCCRLDLGQEEVRNLVSIRNLQNHGLVPTAASTWSHGGVQKAVAAQARRSDTIKRMNDQKTDAIKTALKDSAVLQIGLGILLVPLFDGGICASIWFYSMAAYWIGCGIVISKRWRTPTKPDIFLVKWGFALLCLIVTPAIAGIVWAARGIRIN